METVPQETVLEDNIKTLIRYLLKIPQNYKNVVKAAWIIIGYQLQTNCNSFEDTKIPKDLIQYLNTPPKCPPYWLVLVSIEVLNRVLERR